MQGSIFRFYVQEGHRLHGRLVWEWLLEQGKKLGLRGGVAFKTIASVGLDGVLCEARFFELAGRLIVGVEFLVTQDEAQRLLDMLHREKVDLLYACMPVSFGMVRPDVSNPPAVCDGST